MPSADSLTVQIRSRIDYEAVFGQFLTLHGTGAERNARCIFHDDRLPSMSVNVEEGLYCCHNPDCGASGDIFTFYQRVRSLTFPETVNELARMVGLDPDRDRGSAGGLRGASADRAASGGDDPARVQPADEDALIADYLSRMPGATPVAREEEEHVIDEAIVEAMHTRLVNTPSLMQYLEERRGLTQATVERFKLGHDGQRYYIPIRDEEGRCVNIRRYKPDARDATFKMISWRQGFGEARLFPLDALDDRIPVFLFEGEMDCLLARQMGLNAMSTTGGAGTWRDVWNPLFEGRRVVICYDNDRAGHAGAARIASAIHQYAEWVKVITVPLTEPSGADLTDFIVGHGHTLGDFLTLVEQAPAFQPTPESEAAARQGVEPLDLHLSAASEAEHYNRPVRVKVMVSGKTHAPFIVPREVRVGCPTAVRGTMTMCERCPVAAAAASITKRIEFENNDVLQFVNTHDQALQRSLKAKVGVPVKCGYARSEVLEAMNVEEVQLIPEIERTDAATPYVTRQAYFIGHGLQTNQSYLMTGITVPEPKRQLATHLIHSAVQSQSNIDAFRLTPDVVQRLRVFNPSQPGVEGLWAKLGTVYEDLERVIRIYQRRDLMLAVDLTFHSIVQFSFQGDRLRRGWCEALIIGDSRTGKSTVVERMVGYYGAGELTTGENTTLAGLVGGLHQVGTSWALQWGRIPLNDRRLLVVDEAGNLPQEQISRMSSMRSSGVAEVIKVHTERTNARTRQIWISNPRSPRPLSSFSQGVLAVRELIGAPEDIARFDLVVTAATGDVPLSVVNAPRHAESAQTFTSELCHQRVMWAWSRGADQIVWASGAETRVLALATEQGEKYRYATEVPLVEPNEQRVKLARLAVSAAALFFSTDAEGNQVIVRPEHVEFAHTYLEMLYAKPSLSFAEYADQQRQHYELSDVEAVRRIILGRNRFALRAMMQQEQFTQRDLGELLGIGDRDSLRETVATLRDVGFFRRYGSSFYVKTPAAIRWLRRELGGEAAETAVNRIELLTNEPLPANPEW